jgi:hypothetical protein
MVDCDRFSAFADFIADCGFDLQFTAGLKTEFDRIPYGTSDPAILGYSRHSGKTHSSRPADNLQDAWDRVDALNSSDVRRHVCRHRHHSTVSHRAPFLVSSRVRRHPGGTPEAGEPSVQPNS